MKLTAAILLSLSFAAGSVFAKQPYYQCVGKLKGKEVKFAGYYRDAATAEKQFSSQRKGTTDITCTEKK